MIAPSVARHTLRALARPRRLVPILLVCAPLLLAQHRFSVDPRAVPLGALTCALFVLVAPLSWRVLLPPGLSGGQVAWRMALYLTLGLGVMLTVGVAIPILLGIGYTFLTERYSLAVACALFVVGGWGLARDIEMEDSLSRERARAENLQRAAEAAQLLALRSHFDPHFLFNTLNAIAEWCREDGAVAEAAILQLSAMLRTVLEGVKATAWPLERELELARTLFALHLLRDAGLFRLTVEVPRELNAVPVPPMLLLPLAENAVKHGPAAGHRGELRLTARRTGDEVVVVLENPGPYRGPRDGSDGLPTLRRRLQLAYDQRARLTLEPVGDRTRAILVFPAGGPR
jgi:two-component system sensor histidine kinase AlgZ